jgi:hypothetical protein
MNLQDDSFARWARREYMNVLDQPAPQHGHGPWSLKNQSRA